MTAGLVAVVGQPAPTRRDSGGVGHAFTPRDDPRRRGAIGAPREKLGLVIAMVVDEPTAVGRPVVEGNAGLVFERLARSLAGLDGEGSGGRIDPAPRNVGDRLSVGGDTGIAAPVVAERESIFDTTQAVHHP